MSNDDKSPKTWKEWAIEMSTDQENLEEKVEVNCKRLNDLIKEYEDLKERFIKLETRVYFAVIAIPFLIGIIEFIIKFIE